MGLRRAKDELERRDRQRAEEEARKKLPKPLNQFEKEFLEETGAKLRRLEVRAQVFCQTMAQAAEGKPVDCSEKHHCPVNLNKWYVSVQAKTAEEAQEKMEAERQKSARNIAKKLQPKITIMDGETTMTYDKLQQCQVGLDTPRIKG